MPYQETQTEVLLQETGRTERGFTEIYAISSPQNPPRTEVLGVLLGDEQGKMVYSTDAIVDLIVREAQKHGVNVEVALQVAFCESGYNPNAVGDHNLGGSRGLWQIHAPSHPAISAEQAFDPYWSTEFAMINLKANPEIWTCWRQLYG